MALEAGSAEEGTGLAGAIAAARKKAYGRLYKVKDDARSIDMEAAAIIDYLVANTEVEVVDITVGSETAAGTIS